MQWEDSHRFACMRPNRRRAEQLQLAFPIWVFAFAAVVRCTSLGLDKPDHVQSAPDRARACPRLGSVCVLQAASDLLPAVLPGSGRGARRPCGHSIASELAHQRVPRVTKWAHSSSCEEKPGLQLRPWSRMKIWIVVAPASPIQHPPIGCEVDVQHQARRSNGEPAAFRPGLGVLLV